ncbi:MAG TPA: hypothetical protein VG944_17795, partial [Fimbriimonas sp.]|nr:hypothetical protein [Fimbriimonas sp.]
MSLDSVAPLWISGMMRACWQGALVIVVVWLVCAILLRKASPSSRAALWWLACLKCLIALTVSAVIAVPILSSQQASAGALEQDKLDVFGSTGLVKVPNSSSGQVKAGSTAKPVPAGEAASATLSWPELFLGVWAIGLVGVGIWTLRQWNRVRSLLNNSKLLNDSPI